MRLMSWLKEKLRAGRPQLAQGPPPEDEDTRDRDRELRQRLIESARKLHEEAMLVSRGRYIESRKEQH